MKRGLVNVPRLGTNCGHIYHILFGFSQYSESIYLIYYKTEKLLTVQQLLNYIDNKHRISDK